MASKKKNKGVGVACCLLVALVIFIIFIVQRKTIAENLKDTQLFERLGIKTPKVIEDYEIPEKAQSEEEIPLKEETFTIHIDNSTENKSGNASGRDAAGSNKSSASQNEIARNDSINDSKNDSKPADKSDSATNSKSDLTADSKSDAAKKESAKTNENNKPATTAEIKYTELQLCFVDYGADGIVSRKMVKRSVPKNDAPLTTAIKLLLEGPDITKNTEKDCLTLIPENTRLISARVENGIAYLNFSEDFEFNSFGVDGYRSQLMQIVYTATAFSNVKSVQFLIEGQKKEYLGSEGQRIGSALSRNSF